MGEEELSTLMERLRVKKGEQKSWADSIKALRSVVAQEKRHLVETLDRIHIQRCLDTLQSAIKVLGQQSMVARLRCIARQTSMTFSEKPPNTVILSSDLFQVEICLDPEKTVNDVNISHQGETTSSYELLRLLSSGELTLFTKHLEGLTSCYNINGDKKQRTKAFHALQSLETDLNLVAQLQNSINSVGNYIHKSPLGCLIPRNVGLPMKLIYFVSPYDLLDKKTKAAHPMTVEAIIDNEIGQSVTVCLESHSSTPIQTMPLMTVNTLQEGRSLPYFSAVSSLNSCSLPACFVLQLPKAIPLTISLVKKIHNLTNIDPAEGLKTQPLLSLIVENESDEKMTGDSELFVTLPNQQHQYFLQEGCGISSEGAVLVSKIPFTHPTHVPKILGHLRQQLLFNSLIGSCVRPSANLGEENNGNSMVFEVSALSLQNVTVTFEHPLQQTMATADLDLSDITNVRCKVLCMGETEPFVTDDQATKVFQRCLSIPVTMRNILMKVTDQLKKLIADEKIKSLQAKRASRPVPPLIIPRPYMHLPPVLHHQHSAPAPHQYQHRSINDYEHPALLDPSSASPELLDSLKAEKVAKNPMLASLLDEETGVREMDNPVLSRLLDDQAPTVTSLPQKPKKTRKRKPDSLPGRSPKHRPSEESELETPSPLDIRLTPTSSTIQTPLIDLTENFESPGVGESHVSKLAHTVNKIIVDSTKNESPTRLTEPHLTPGMKLAVNNVDNMLTDSTVKGELNEYFVKRTSFSDLWPSPSEVGGPIDADLFTNKNVKVKRSCSRQSSVSQHSELMEFDTEVFNTDLNFSENLTDNGSEEACDASAFGAGVNSVTEMASKFTTGHSRASMSSKHSSDSLKTGIKRRLSESPDCEKANVKSERDTPSPLWKKPDLLTSRKNSEMDLSSVQRRKVESDSTIIKKSESESCLTKKKSEMENILKNTSPESDSSSWQKYESDILSKKKSDSEIVRKKGESHSTDFSQSNNRKSESDLYSLKKKTENDVSSANRKKSESPSSHLLKTEGGGSDSPSKKKSDNEIPNTSKRKSSDSDSSVYKKSSEDSSSSNKSWLKPDPDGQGLKMKISTRQLEGRSVASPLQALDFSKNSKSNHKGGKDSSSDSNRGGLAMAVTSVAYNSQSLKTSNSPLLNPSISPSKALGYSPSKSSNYSPSSKSPSSHSSDKNNKTSKVDKSRKTKHPSGSDSSKRKREKEEYKREKKKKKLDSFKDDLLYSSSVNYTDLNDKKQMPKLKITKSGGKVTVQTSSPQTVPSVKVNSSPRKSSQANLSSEDAFSFSRSELLEKEELDRKLSHMRQGHSRSSKLTNSNHKSEKSPSNSQKSSHKSSQKSSSKNITVSKADSKLITKTPTIKLKPIVIPSSGASMHVSGSSKNSSSSPQSTPVNIPNNVGKIPSHSPHSSPSQSSSRSGTPTLQTPVSRASPNTISPTCTTKTGAASNQTPSSNSSSNSQSANKLKSPGRLRKGSLSAVIDKLTKSTTVIPGSKEDSIMEGESNSEPKAVTVPQINNLTKGLNTTNCVNKSPAKSPNAVQVSKMSSDVEKVINNSVSSGQKDNSPRKDKIDSSHKPKSDSSKSSQRKSVSSSKDRDRPRSSSSTSSSRSVKEDSNKSESSSSKQNSHSGKSHSSSGSSSHSQNSGSKSHTNNNLPKSSSSSSSSQSRNSTSSSNGAKVSSSSNAGSASSRAASPSVNNKSSRHSSQNSAHVSSKTIGYRPSTPTQSQNSHVKSSGSVNQTSSNSSVKEKSGETVDKNSKSSQPPVVLNDKLSKGLTVAGSKESSKDNSSIKSSSSSSVKDSTGASNSNVHKTSESRVDFDTWTPASPTEDKEYRSAEETAKIPVLERFNLEYTQDPSSSPKTTSPSQEETPNRQQQSKLSDTANSLQTKSSDSSSQDDVSKTVKHNSRSPSESQKSLNRASPVNSDVKNSNNSQMVDPVFVSSISEKTDTKALSDHPQDDVPFTRFVQCNGESSSAKVEKSSELKALSPQTTHTSSNPPELVKNENRDMESPSPMSKKARSNSNNKSNSRPVSSPHSDASSPGMGLVIDFPVTPKSNHPSAQCSPSPVPKADVVTPSSPDLVPTGFASPSPGQVDIDDDDLMDDIVLGMGS